MDAMINILLLEDDEVDVMNVKRAFKKNNVDNPLFVAENGVEAFEMLRGENGKQKIGKPNIILLDLNMPKMGGLEFLKLLRKEEEFKDISVFVMTTSDKDSDIVEAYNLNVAGYILKPLSISSFMESISALKNYWKLCEYPRK